MTTTARAVIDLDVPGPTISRHLYGHFAEHLGRCIYGGFWVGEDSDVPNEGGIRLDVVEALRALQIPNLRWPGGCFADEYHWRDGIGPRSERPRMVNTHWGDVVEDNSFGTHEFMALCELLGTEPYVNGNVGSGTVREMSEWVEYLTRPGTSPMADLRRANGRDEPWKVPFWGIGNEAWGCGGNMRAEAYADLARQYATFCRDHGDNSLYRIAAGASNGDYAWTEALMKAISCLGCTREPRGFFQGISFHYYTVPGPWHDKGSALEFDTDDYYTTMVKARGVEEIIRGHAAVMDVYDPGKTVGLVLDEWGTWWNVEPGTNPGFLYQQNTLRDALVASVHFDAFHRHADRLFMANIAQTVNVLQAMILTDPESGALVLTPTYHVFEMNTGHHDAAALDVHLTGAGTKAVGDGELELISASASVKGDTALVSLTNLDADGAASVVLDLRGRSVVASRGRILTADSLQTHNTPDAAAVAPSSFDAVSVTDDAFGHGLAVEIPAHSYVTLELDLA
ncbi:Alpha-N-arabinofuranosidase [Beutenbergia cavernae DSM 12333]|uniref:non-reducing end alpha-L-arabinofuranosidase n=1 Tax=Beutenbergia cavernae (strain ATCC BAA-8 / DSM 12333 / CCUG 43141 / JCM 11478 / NBRC 16432 / NCIMB 13614 / HKI 0122) TaxID=471853 RepID=C5BUV7_BEUC1|nr:alpha-L-arabinofuranosidase C-terminal domain-containing protein [Beutenbergia cavernae]ACQ78331.1 Alpha-N-arabinofuranosidase [Beutenbergia cavernae DSM 12333]